MQSTQQSGPKPVHDDRRASCRGARVQRFLRRGHATGVLADGVLEQAVPPDTWVPWQQARDYVAGSLAGDIWSAGGWLDDLGGLAVWARCRAEWLLADAVGRGVLAVQEVLAPRRSGGSMAWLSSLGTALCRGRRAAMTRLCPTGRSGADRIRA